MKANSITAARGKEKPSRKCKAAVLDDGVNKHTGGISRLKEREK